MAGVPGIACSGPTESELATRPPDAVGAGDQEHRRPVDELADALAKVVPESGTTLVLDHVELTNEPVGGPMADHLRLLLSEAASRLPDVTLIDDEETDALLARIAGWMGDAYDEETLPDLGNFSGARHILESSYVDMGDTLRVSLQIRDLETLVSKSSSAILQHNHLPALALQPSNADRLRLQYERWEQEVLRDAFQVVITTDRGVGAIYAPGDELRVFVRSAAAGHLRVELMDASGDVTKIFPNIFHESDDVRAGSLIEIPDESMGFRLDLSGPPAGQILRALVETDDGHLAQGFCAFRIAD